MKEMYATQAILLGSKAKSLAVVIPAKIVRALGMDESTVLAVKLHESSGLITIEALKGRHTIESGSESA